MSGRPDTAASNGAVPDQHAPYALALDDFLALKLDGGSALIGTDEDNILPGGGLLILFGKGGKGKTTLAVDLALHAASGIAWLDFAISRPLHILIIENEGPIRPFQRKLASRRAGWSHDITGAIYIKTLDWGAFRIDAEGEAPRLRAFIEQEHIDLVIGDPLDTLGLKGVGSPEDTRDLMAQLVGVGLTRDVAFLLLHHPRKEEASEEIDEAAGAWGGKPDTMLKLSVLPGERSRLSFPKVRWGAVAARDAYILAFDPATESFTVAGREHDLVERDLVQEIRELLADGRWRTLKEAAASKKAEQPGIGAKEDLVRLALEAHPDIFASRPGNEVGRRRDATCWQLLLSATQAPLQMLQIAAAGEGVGVIRNPQPPDRGTGGAVADNPPATNARLQVEPLVAEEEELRL